MTVVVSIIWVGVTVYVTGVLSDVVVVVVVVVGLFNTTM